MYHLYFYAPAEHLETIKQALFQAGAGKYRHYDQCCWQTKGAGQYRPLEGNQAYQGETNQLEKAEEYKVEMICTDEVLEAVVKALHKAHPYEEPAYGIIELR